MEKVINHLNVLLSDLAVCYRKLQNYHWNVKGEDFFEAHEKLEEYYDDMNAQIDEIAEHILILGGQPLGTMKDYLEKTTLKEAENVKLKSKEIFVSVKKDYEALLDEVIRIKEEADEVHGYGTSSLMDEYISNFAKKIWMINQKIYG